MGFKCPRSLRFESETAVCAAIAAALAPSSPALAADAPAAPPTSVSSVDVQGRQPEASPYANPAAPYKVERLATAKITEPLIDVPKSIVVIPKEVIADAGALSFRDLMRTQPGVTLGTGEGGNAFGDRFFVRGFDTRNDVYIDGVRDPGVGTREVFNVEQVEVLKGPSSTFGGRGTTGAAISLVSKAPASRSFLHAASVLGTDDTHRATLDANAALSERLAVRVNAMVQEANVAGRNFVFNDRWGVAVAAAWRARDDLSLSGEYYHLTTSELPDWGVGYDVLANRPLIPDRRLWYGVLARDYRDTWADLYTGRLDWTPSAAITVHGLARRGQTLNSYVASAPENPNLSSPDPALWTLLANPKQRNAVTTYTTFQLDAQARFATLGIRHSLAAGLESDNEHMRNRQYANLAAELGGGQQLQPNTIIQSVLAPNPYAPWPFPRALSAVRTTRVQSRSAYGIDTLKFGDRWQVLAGLRYDTFDVTLATLTAGSGIRNSLRHKSDFVNGSLGLVYKPAPQATLYAAYGTSSNPSGEQLDAVSGEYGALTTGNAALSAERNTSYEAGVKWDVFDRGLNLTAAVFRIDKVNARVQIAPGAAGLNVSGGAQRVDGLEVTASGNITPRWSVFGGVTRLRGRTIRSPVGNQEGHEFPNIAKAGFSMLSRYQLTPALSLGGFANYGGEKYGGTVIAGSTRVPAYWRFDAFATYQVTPRWSFSAKVLNVADKTYFDALYRSVAPFTYVAPGRAAYLRLDMTL